MNAQWHIATPAGIPGAVAIIHLTGDVEEALASAGIKPVPPGRMALRDLCAVDRGVLARWSDRSAFLMPHGGVAVVREIARALAARGIPERRSPDWCALYPEARDEIEARMLVALARAASPLAIDLLLDQPRRWRMMHPDEDCTARSAILNRLLEPPLVVAVGPPNVGKSTLLNALAGRGVSIVTDEPGTTRDHVGVLLDLAGLVVRWVDTPGLRPAAGAESEAIRLSLALLPAAALVVECFDAASSLSDLAPEATGFARASLADILTVQLRTDLGVSARPADARVSTLHAHGLRAFVETVRERLVPRAVLEHPGPWRFWPDH
jgi:hypothetical protein